MIGTFPFFILHIEIDPSIIDINVHPKKLEIRFEDEEFIYNKVFNVIRQFVQTKFMKSESTETAMDLSSFMPDSVEKSRENAVIEESTKGESEDGKKSSIQLKITDSIGTQSPSNDTYVREKRIKSKNFPSLRLISNTGQLSNKVYVVLEGTSLQGEEGIYVLDQHAASERITTVSYTHLTLPTN